MYNPSAAQFAAAIEATEGTDPMSTPSGNEVVKVHGAEVVISQSTFEDDGISRFQAGWKRIPGQKRFSGSGTIELAALAVSANTSRPRGYQFMEAAGFDWTYAAGPPKTITAKFSPSNVKTLTLRRYLQHMNSGGETASNWLDKLLGAKVRARIQIRNGVWVMPFELLARDGSRTNGASMLSDGPCVDTEGEYRAPLRFGKTTFTLADSNGDNVASGLVNSFDLDLGQELAAEYGSNGSDKPTRVDRIHGPVKGTMRLLAVNRSVSDPLAVLEAGRTYALTAAAADEADADLTTTLSAILSPEDFNQSVDGGKLYWDIPFQLAYPSDGTAVGRTPASPLSITWANAN